MNSCLYQGQVWHRRNKPVTNKFSYGVYMAYLDLDELEEVFRGRWLWSTRRWAPFRFRREDHLGGRGAPLADCVRTLVAERTGCTCRGPIRLLTNLRHFGYVFNPVSFHFCFDPAGENLEAVVADVRNTPWNERYRYALDLRREKPAGNLLQAEQPKEFHVSPFMGMDTTYRFRFSIPGEKLIVHIDCERQGASFFRAGLNLRRLPINGRTLARIAVCHPLMPFKVIFAIHWQALRLWRKGAPYVPHPGRVVPAPPKGDGAP